MSLFVCEDADALSRALPWSTLIFARQKLRLFADLQGLDPRDRITPMLAALPPGIRFGELVMEHPDSEVDKPMAGLARSLGNALRPALRKAGVLTPTRQPPVAAPACVPAGRRQRHARQRRAGG